MHCAEESGVWEFKLSREDPEGSFHEGVSLMSKWFSSCKTSRRESKRARSQRPDNLYLQEFGRWSVNEIATNRPRLRSVDGLRKLCMDSFETDCSTLPASFHPNQVTAHASLPIDTVGDGACALHSLLGEHVLDGSIVCAPAGVLAGTQECYLVLCLKVCP